MKKIAIIGSGRVGESTAHDLAVAELAHEIALFDVREDQPQGAALDIMESAPVFGFDTALSGHNDYAALIGAEMVIITAGLPRKEGMSRSDVLEANLAVVHAVVDEVVRHAPHAMLCIVTNPVDVITYAAWKRSGFPRSRVFGLSGVLDSNRMASFIAMETGLSVKDVSAMVLGGHGDNMVPLPRFSCIHGIPLAHFLTAEKIAAICERARQGGAEILRLRKISSAYDAPAAAIATMVDAVVHDRKRVLPCVAILDGEYGERDVAMGVPVVLGGAGVEEIIELSLDDSERAEFCRSLASVRADLARTHKSVP